MTKGIVVVLLGVSLVGCGKVNLKGLEICTLSTELAGGRCSGLGGVQNKTYADLNGYTCTNAVGKKALLKQAKMSEAQAFQALGLQTQ